MPAARRGPRYASCVASEASEHFFPLCDERAHAAREEDPGPCVVSLSRKASALFGKVEGDTVFVYDKAADAGSRRQARLPRLSFLSARK